MPRFVAPAGNLLKSSSSNSIRFSALSRRFLSFIADLALAYMAFYALLSSQVYAQKYRELTVFIFKTFELKEVANGYILSQAIGTVVFVFGLYLAFRFYVSLALGVSLSQWLVGLRGVGNKVWKRVGGGARVVLELILGPLLIGEALLLFGKPSLKETLSHTQVEPVRNKWSLYLAWIWVPGLIVFSTVSPLFQGLTLMDGIVINPVKENLDLEDQGDFNSFKNYHSNRFKFRAFSSLGGERFLLLPNFEVVKEGTNKKIKPFLWLYDQKTQRDAYIKIENRFSLLRVVEKGQLGNPLFKKHFPHLAETLEKDKGEFIKKKYRKEYEAEKFLSSETRKDIEKLVKTSLALGSSKFFDHVFQFGPFYRGFVNVRNNLVEKAFQGIVPEVDFGKIGTHSFLRFKQLFDEKIFRDKRMVETYIPIETNNSLAMRFYWGEDLQSALSRKNFRESFLQSTTWYFDYFNIFPFPTSSEEVNSLTILDHFTKTDLSVAERSRLEEAIFRLYFKLGRKSVQVKDKKMQEILLSNLNRIYLVSNFINDSKRNYYSQKFLVHLRDLRHALKNSEANYFGLSQR